MFDAQALPGLGRAEARCKGFQQLANHAVTDGVHRDGEAGSYTRRTSSASCWPGAAGRSRGGCGRMLSAAVPLLRPPSLKATVSHLAKRPRQGGRRAARAVGRDRHGHNVAAQRQRPAASSCCYRHGAGSTPARQPQYAHSQAVAARADQGAGQLIFAGRGWIERTSHAFRAAPVSSPRSSRSIAAGRVGRVRGDAAKQRAAVHGDDMPAGATAGSGARRGAPES